MQIRFGYVSHALSLYECAPSKTMTYKRWTELNKIERQEKLIAITAANIRNTLRAIFYNISQEIPLYRLSSSMIPLATHPKVDFDFVHLFQNELKEIGDLVKKYQLRVSFHPGQFTLFTSDQQHITDNSIISMKYHYDILEAMGIAQETYMNIHVGGAYGNKSKAIERFHTQIKQLPPPILKQMTLENDDKTYTAAETLAICQKEKMPFVFDYHHHITNPGDVSYKELLPAIFETWEHTGLPPKIHISSPKSEKEVRSHADYVNLAFVLPFFTYAKSLGKNFDIMIEAKKKDLACLQLVEQLGKQRGYKRIAGGIIEGK
ncbi:MAG: UV DNA damage repair endonuclease UvsE [Bacillaceae bacterium]